MRMAITVAVGALLLTGCTENKAPEVASTEPAATTATQTGAPATDTAASTATDTVASPATDDAEQPGTWAGQIKVAAPVSMFNYVGAESGDFAPMRFRNDSDAGRKILAVCRNDDHCEFTGIVEWLDEPPPPDASAIGQIVRVDSVKRVPAPQ